MANEKKVFKHELNRIDSLMEILPHLKRVLELEDHTSTEGELLSSLQVVKYSNEVFVGIAHRLKVGLGGITPEAALEILRTTQSPATIAGTGPLWEIIQKELKIPD